MEPAIEETNNVSRGTKVFYVVCAVLGLVGLNIGLRLVTGANWQLAISRLFLAELIGGTLLLCLAYVGFARQLPFSSLPLPVKVGAWAVISLVGGTILLPALFVLL